MPGEQETIVENAGESATDDASLDQIMNDAQGSTVDPAEIVENPAAAADPADPMLAEYEYKASGQTVKESLGQIIKRASQGYHYAQQMAEHNKNVEAFDAREKEWAPKFKTYEAVDKWAQENPQQWEATQKSFANQNISNELDPNVQQALAPLHEQMGTINKFIQDFNTNQQMQQSSADDAALTKDVDAIKEQYKDLDWATLNEQGKSLEAQVLEHAEQTGIPSFRAAFSDLYLPKLLSRERERGKDQAAKNIQRVTKMGILGTSPTPTQQTKVNHSNLNYNELEQLALAEIEGQKGA